MFTIWIIFHVIVSVALVLVVLMQSSKGEGLAGSAFGGSGGLSGAVFGGRGAASFLSRATTVLAILFMVNCGVLAFMSAGQRGGSAPGTGTVESVVTQQAQEDMARRQQMQQLAPTDSVGAVELPPAAEETPAEPQPAPADTGGGGQ
ncbi:MAG: preprotein translocase subunit SecG [Candidatus Zixiibacteriota bacterium]|nr:MAG: preprotein translocase subunit SecG [candidate division Zixibacteria bacterium]